LGQRFEEFEEGVSTLNARTWAMRAMRRLGREHGEESGAEMVEFAFVVILLIMLLYGIVTYGLILAAQATVTQAAADGARSGIVAPSTAVATAEAQASQDLGWMGKGACNETSVVTTCTASQDHCKSNSANTCLTVTVTYHYNQSPLFPELPGLNIVTPSSISSTNVLQVSEPSGNTGNTP
jgi:Flp pilus assembly protein TadG